MTRLPHDPALPRLAQALNPALMAQVLGAALADRTVTACEIDRVKYRPGRNCTVSYVLTVHGAPPGAVVTQRVAARFCSGGDSARRHEAARGRAVSPSAAGPSLLHMPELDMLAHWLPNDARLDSIALLLDAARLRSHALPALVAVSTGGRGRLLDHHTTLVRYVPESRACARVELAIQRDPGAMAEFETVFAKTDASRGGERTHAAMRALWQSPARSNGGFAMAEPLLWQPAAGLHWQRGVPGQVLPDADPAVGARNSARVAGPLAALHATPVAGLCVVDAAALRRQLLDVTALLGRVAPDWRARLARLTTRLEAGLDRIETEPRATLHGDLHPGNIVVDAGTPTFIDLDGARAGAAVLELGAWVGDALYRATLGPTPQREAAPAWRAFLAAYASASGRPIDARLLAWSVAHHLVCQRAYRGVANLKPGRYERVPALLALADAIATAGSVDAALACDEAAA